MFKLIKTSVIVFLFVFLAQGIFAGAAGAISEMSSDLSAAKAKHEKAGNKANRPDKKKAKGHDVSRGPKKDFHGKYSKKNKKEESGTE